MIVCDWTVASNTLEMCSEIKKQNPNICLLGASFGTNNMGVNALTAGTLKAFYEQYPDGELFLLDYAKSGAIYEFQIGGRTVPLQLVNIRFSKKFYLRNNIAFLIALTLFARFIPFYRLRKVIIKNYWIGRMEEADVIVSIAGGDSFSDIYGLRRFLYVSLPQILALLLGKKLVLLPQTIGPFQGTIARAIAKFILQKARAIYSRDHAGLGETRELLGSNNINGKVRFCYDVGFVVDPVKPSVMDLDGLLERRGRDFPVVGFNVSGLLFMGGYSRKNMFGFKINYRQLVYDVIEHLIQQKSAIMLLIPHVFGEREHAESDSVACEMVYAELKQKYQEKLYMVRGRYDQGEIKHIIGLCDFFIGSRMHACIAALSQNTPTVSIAYSKKFAGVMQTIGVENLVADPRKLEKDEIIRIIDDAFDQRALLREHLETTMPHVKETVLKLFIEIGSLLQGK